LHPFTAPPEGNRIKVVANPEPGKNHRFSLVNNSLSYNELDAWNHGTFATAGNSIHPVLKTHLGLTLAYIFRG
jgi:hypothetical protein